MAFFQESELKKVPGEIEMMPLSITLYELEMKVEPVDELQIISD